MPIEVLDEDGLPKNPDLQLVQWRFLLSVDETMGVNKDDVWASLLQAIKENGECALVSWSLSAAVSEPAFNPS